MNGMKRHGRKTSEMRRLGSWTMRKEAMEGLEPIQSVERIPWERLRWVKEGPEENLKRGSSGDVVVLEQTEELDSLHDIHKVVVVAVAVVVAVVASGVAGGAGECIAVFVVAIVASAVVERMKRPLLPPLPRQLLPQHWRDSIDRLLDLSVCLCLCWKKLLTTTKRKGKEKWNEDEMVG